MRAAARQSVRSAAVPRPPNPTHCDPHCNPNPNRRYLRDAQEPPYFIIPRIQRIAKQCLEGLAYVHSLNLIHCDLKPENILIKSFSRCEIKVIDFGSTCFTTDHLTSYVQSRSYRAPEVILGCPYGQKIDIWSLGCILSELLTGDVLFENMSIQSLLARVQAFIGPFPKEMLQGALHTDKYFSADMATIFETDEETGETKYHQLEASNLGEQMKTDDTEFVEFVNSLLTIDQDERPTAEECLQHPWFQKEYEMPVAEAAPATGGGTTPATPGVVEKHDPPPQEDVAPVGEVEPLD